VIGIQERRASHVRARLSVRPAQKAATVQLTIQASHAHWNKNAGRMICRFYSIAEAATQRIEGLGN
jgi:hypothetical protein